MPLYEYQCAQCGRFEVIQKFSDALLAHCPTCGGEVHKLPSAPAIQFKGSGWYVTDYARKSADAKKDAGGKGESAKGEGPSSEGKSEASKTAPASPTGGASSGASTK